MTDCKVQCSLIEHNPCSPLLPVTASCSKQTVNRAINFDQKSVGNESLQRRPGVRLLSRASSLLKAIPSSSTSLPENEEPRNMLVVAGLVPQKAPQNQICTPGDRKLKALSSGSGGACASNDWQSISHHLSYTPSPQARRRLDLGLVAHHSVVKRPALFTPLIKHELQSPAVKRSRLQARTPQGRASPALSVVSEAGSTPSNTRFDNSLLLLTKRFIDMQRATNEKTVNLNEVAQVLGVQKRRLYDITNVLEGINMVEKVGKNSIQWLGDKNDEVLGSRARELTQETHDQQESENALDSMINELTAALSEIRADPLDAPYAYTTYESVRSVSPLQKSTVIAIKAPARSELHTTDPVDTGKHEMLIRSSDGNPVQVFLCPDHELQNTAHKQQQEASALSVLSEMDSTLLHSPVKTCLLSQATIKSSPLMKGQSQYNHYNNNSGTQYAQQQHLHSAPNTNLLHTPQKYKQNAGPISLSLEPGHSQNGADDYLFALGPSEGLGNLFDDSRGGEGPGKDWGDRDGTKGGRHGDSDEQTTARLTSASILSI